MISCTVREFINLCCEPDWLEFSVYNIYEGKQIFKGYMQECPDYILDTVMESYDAPNLSNGFMCFNISLED